MTLRFIVGRILRELIELAERAADAELVDALHNALDLREGPIRGRQAERPLGHPLGERDRRGKIVQGWRGVR